MPDEPPAFPKPRARGGREYREPARVAPVDAEPRARVVVSRPEPVVEPVTSRSKPSREPSPELARELLAPHPIHAERTYWEKHRFFYRHPRLCAVFLLVGSCFLVGPSLASHGAYASTRGLVLGAAFGLSGIWVLGAGAPLDPDGHPPGWWQAGFVGCMAAGFALGAVLAAVL
jgi:hypothetical protein